MSLFPIVALLAASLFLRAIFLDPARGVIHFTMQTAGMAFCIMLVLVFLDGFAFHGSQVGRWVRP